jgi:predicted RNA-binding protein with PUA-like domain
MARARAERSYWLMKSEPDCFSFDDLWNAPRRRTGWSGVRNHQVRNFMRDAMRIGDGVLFYHASADPPGVAGVARIAGAARPDPTQFDPSDEHFDPKSSRDAPTWLEVEVEAMRKLARFVSIEDLRSAPELSEMLVLHRGQRLSVMPVTAREWRAVLSLGGLDARDF